MVSLQHDHKTPHSNTTSLGCLFLLWPLGQQQPEPQRKGVHAGDPEACDLTPGPPACQRSQPVVHTVKQ